MTRIKYLLADLAVIYVFLTSILFHIAFIAHVVKWLPRLTDAMK